MTRLVVSLILIVSLISGCTSLDSRPIGFRAAPNTSFTISSDQFDTVEIQSSEIHLWKDSDLVGSITTIEKNPNYQSAIEEVKQGFIEAQRGPGKTSLLALPDGAYGFSTSFSGYTTAFIAIHDQPESWITISTRDSLFKGVLSSITIKDSQSN